MERIVGRPFAYAPAIAREIESTFDHIGVNDVLHEPCEPPRLTAMLTITG